MVALRALKQVGEKKGAVVFCWLNFGAVKSCVFCFL